MGQRPVNSPGTTLSGMLLFGFLTWLSYQGTRSDGAAIAWLAVIAFGLTTMGMALDLIRANRAWNERRRNEELAWRNSGVHDTGWRDTPRKDADTGRGDRGWD